MFKAIFTLKTKLVLLFLFLALAPLSVIGVFSINITEALIEDLVLRQLENVAADKAVILERWLEERRQDLQVIAGTSIVRSMDPELITPYFDLIQNHYGVYNNMMLISAAGEMVISAHAPEAVVDINELIRAAAGKTTFLSEVYYLPKEEVSVFNVATPVFEAGRRIGTVCGMVGTHNIIYTILQISLGKTGECYLVDSNGIFLAHKEPHRILTENISQSESFKNIFGNRDRRKTYLDYRNIEVLGTSRKIGGTDWHIVVEQDGDEAFQGVETLKQCINFTIILAIGSALVLTWAISRHVVGPIRTLSRLADTLAKAEFDTAVVKTNRQDEIGILFRAFGAMALKIRERHDDLEQQFNLKAAELKQTDHTLKRFKLIAERSEKFAALGRLGAAVAHEIRTPLTSLKLFLDSVQAEIEISPEYSEDFTIAMGQIVRIEDAINRMLDFTKPKELVFSKVGISRLIDDVVSIIRPLANKQECIIETEVEAHLPDIKVDKKFLEEALINLIINSLEAMTGNGNITVTAESDHFKKNGGALPCIRIDITDSGDGISDANMDLIFDPFFTTKPSGTGLGLPLVLNIIKHHDGEIRVQNHMRGGAVFSLFLPIETA